MVSRIGFWSELDSPISALFQIASSENLPILPEVPPPSKRERVLY